MGSRAVGVALALSAATMNATGVNLQRLGRRRGSRALTALGIFLATACGAVDVVSFSFAPQSFLAPFGALSLVINLLLAPVLHDDKIHRLDVLCTAFVVLGVALCLANNTVVARKWSLEELQQLAAARLFRYWLMAQVCIASLASVCILRGPSKPFAGPCFALIAGLLGGCTALSAKLMSELVGVNAPTDALIGTGFAIGVFALCQISILNAGLGRHSSLIVVPVFVATFVSANAIGGGTFFEEFSSFSRDQARNYLQGAGLVVAGVACLAFKNVDGGGLQAPKAKDE